VKGDGERYTAQGARYTEKIGNRLVKMNG